MSEQKPAGGLVSGESFQHSSAGEQIEVAMQAGTPHSQVWHQHSCPHVLSSVIEGARSPLFVDDIIAAVHVQAQPASRFAFQPGLPLNRSNSAPDLRILLSGPLNAVPQAVLHQQPPPFGGSSTAFALVPYKAPEVWEPFSLYCCH